MNFHILSSKYSETFPLGGGKGEVYFAIYWLLNDYKKRKEEKREINFKIFRW